MPLQHLTGEGLPMSGLWKKLLVLVMFVAAVPRARASQKEDRDDFWTDERLANPAAAAQLVTAYHPLLIWPVYRYQRTYIWRLPDEELPPFAGKFAPSLDPRLLDCLPKMDGKAMPDVRKLKASPDQARFIALYCEALVNAARIPAAAFAESAKEHEHLTFGHLYDQPEKHWGKVVTLKGTLVRVREEEAPFLAQKHDVKKLYEGWLVGPTAGAHPFAVVFAHLPDGVKIAEKIEDGPKVVLHGYFLGRIR